MTTDIDPNRRRVARIGAYLERYAAEQLIDLETALADLLVDSRHFAKARGYDFALALARAEEHFEAEMDGEE